MARFLVPLANGVYESQNLQSIGSENNTFYHQVSFEVDGNPTTGTVEIKARAFDSQEYESIPDGTISFTAPQTLLYQFNTDTYQFTVTGSDVSDGFIIVNDQELKGVTP